MCHEHENSPTSTTPVPHMLQLSLAMRIGLARGTARIARTCTQCLTGEHVCLQGYAGLWHTLVPCCRAAKPTGPSIGELCGHALCDQCAHPMTARMLGKFQTHSLLQ
jgi:hypothetical protein